MKYYIACRKKNGSILSYLIRLFTLSKYSHCFLLIDKNQYVEADGFKKLGLGQMTEDRIKEYDYFELLPQYEEQCSYIKMNEYINSVIGTEYGYGDLIALALSKISGIWQRLIRRIYPQTDNQIICSEFIAQCYHHAGVCLFEKEEYCKLPSPNQISKSKKIRKLTETEKMSIFK